MIARSWNLRPRPGRYDDAIGLIAEGAKLADRHGARDIRLTQAATAGPSTGLLVLTCEFDNLAAYGAYLEDTMADPEAQSHNHRIREAEAPFIYESTAVLTEVDLRPEGGKGGRGRVLDARYGRPLPGRWADTLDMTRDAFELAERHGAVGCRLFELDHAGERSGMLCAVVEYNSLKEFGLAGDAWFADDAGRTLIERMRTDRAFEAVFSGLFTEVMLI
jgi:hypothetical protein